MKLYTENQVEEMLIKARFHNSDGSEMYTNDYLISQYSPIELPSDEEIENEFTEFINKAKFRHTDKIRGAKWVLNKIQGGNK